jgi:hypothetical protein
MTPSSPLLKTVVGVRWGLAGRFVSNVIFGKNELFPVACVGVVESKDVPLLDPAHCAGLGAEARAMCLTLKTCQCTGRRQPAKTLLCLLSLEPCREAMATPLQCHNEWKKIKHRGKRVCTRGGGYFVRQRYRGRPGGGGGGFLVQEEMGPQN